MSRRNSLRATLLCAAMLASCDRPATQIVVVIGSDMVPGDELRFVRVVIQREGAGAPLIDGVYPIQSTAPRTTDLDASPGGFVLPGELAVFSHDPDDSRRLVVQVSAYLRADDGNFTQRAIVRFEPEHLVYLSMFLAGRCRLPENQQCPTGTVCGPAGMECTPIERATTPTPPATSDVPAAVDAPVDATVTCDAGATEQCYDGVDNDCDRLVDEGCAPRSCANATATQLGRPWPTGFDPRLYDSHCAEELVTPSSTFTLGEDPDAAPGESLVEAVRVSPFRIDRYEVTLARFRAFVAAGMPAPPRQVVTYPGGALSARALVGSSQWPVREPVNYSSANRYCHYAPGNLDRESQPINCVDWFTAQAFCVWDGGRLPTEAEWEYTARYLALPESPPSKMVMSGRRFPWGTEQVYCSANYQEPDCASSRARSPADTQYGTWSVDHDSYTTAWQRVYHLAGNVAEWTADVSTAYGVGCWATNASRVDPLCAAPGSTLRMTARGGGYNSLRWEVRGAARQGVDPSERDRARGFRCVRTP